MSEDINDPLTVEEQQKSEAARLNYETQIFGMVPKKWHFLTEDGERKAVLCFMDEESDPFKIVYLPGDETATIDCMGNTYLLFTPALLGWVAVNVDRVMDEVGDWMDGDDRNPDIAAAWGEYDPDEDEEDDPIPFPSA